MTLRLPDEGDIARFVQYGSDEAQLEGVWIVGPRGADAVLWAASFVAELCAGWTPAGGDWGGGLVIDAGGERCVGTVEFLARALRTAELSYGIAPRWRGRGIASRAARLAATWALTDGEFDRVELKIGEAHVASRRVAEKAGFSLIEYFKTYVEGTGRTHKDVLYARTRADG